MLNKEIHPNLKIKMNIKEKKIIDQTLLLIARNLDHHQIDKNKSSQVKFLKEDINQKQDHLKKFKL